MSSRLPLPPLALGVLLVALLLIGGFAVYRTAFAPREVKVAVLFDVGGRGDLSFNDMAALGADRAAKELNVKVDYLTPKDLAHFVPLLEDLSKRGEYELLVLVGFLWIDALDKVADKYPQQKYALIDASTGKARANVLEVLFREQETGALVGVSAAGMARELAREAGGPIKVGSVAGMSIPPLWRFHIGYLFGVKYFEAKTGTKVEFAWVYTGKFDDPAAGRRAAETMLAGGAKVLYGLAGLTHVGMFDAVIDWNAQGRGRALALGQDASQEWYNATYIPLSGSKRVDVAVYRAIEMVVKGEWKGGLSVLGLADGGVGIWDIEGVKYFAQIAYDTKKSKVTPERVAEIVSSQRARYIKEDVQRLMKELEDKIRRGEIVFKDPRDEKEYDAIIKELERGNLNAALAKGSVS
ncbi:MAG: BMP family protein [Acidilobaceae archaeon]|nr:BMP family protein [Acidilobaceae archaeon]MCX8166101.1 BMP family protein [Acidilobaceae archaeon]MDW7974744.1 BMP family protein [Sulfolobales archaeon]